MVNMDITPEIREKRINMLIEMLKNECTYEQLWLETAIPMKTIKSYITTYIKPKYKMEYYRAGATNKVKMRIVTKCKTELYDGLPQDASIKELKAWALYNRDFENIDIPKIIAKVKKRGHKVYKPYKGKKVYQ